MIALVLSLARVASSMGARACSRAVVFVIVASKEIKSAFRIVYRGGRDGGGGNLTDMNCFIIEWRWSATLHGSGPAVRFGLA